MYVYIENKLEPPGSPAKFTVGSYRDDGLKLVWEPESDHGSSRAAAARASGLNDDSICLFCDGSCYEQSPRQL